MDKIVQYFNGDTMAASVWQDKYCLKDRNDVPVEESPTDMHWRMAKEFARIEFGYKEKEITNIQRAGEGFIGKGVSTLSSFGQKLFLKREGQRLKTIEQEFFDYFDKFAQIVPQGSVMSNLGDFFRCGSLSNCFGIASPYDSYGGIFTTDQHIAQLEKRRGGVGTNISTLRYTNAFVSNSARSSTGIPAFAERFSNTTREVAQEGRRGALMLLLMCNHPDIFRFASMKDDRTKVTGANVSVMFTEEFMQALESNRDFYCRFPVDIKISKELIELQELENEPYNVLIPVRLEEKIDSIVVQIMKIKPQELFDLVAEMAWKNGEPGVAYYNRVVDYCPEGVYPQYMPRVCNPCGEQWFAFNETCRLIAFNLWAIVLNHFETNAKIDYDLLYELAYIQQRLGDNLVDLEVEYIDRILEKLANDPEPQHIKQIEIDLWLDIRRIAEEGRRTGNGFTALGDMLAALGMKYDSPEAIATVELVMKTKMRAELDCTIDMAILRGTFVGWDREKEFGLENEKPYEAIIGKNSFYKMLVQEFPQQAIRLYKYGRRNTNWSTVAPTGSVSILTRTTSGMEPLFKAYYIRRRKINPSEAGARVDFTDELGDTWQEYAVLHPKLKEWIVKQIEKPLANGGKIIPNFEAATKEEVQKVFELSPWYGSEADDISWEKRIDIQAIIQKYTSNAISSTINLPENVEQQVVKNIYLRAYHKGLKGVTVYRDKSRSGVLITETSKAPQDQFGYTDAIKRPEELEGHYYSVQVRGKLFAVIVGLLNNLPYELFAFEGPIRKEEITGRLVKIKTGVYSFISPQLTIENVQLSSDHTDEKLLTRMCSQLLRHGVNPKYIVEQVEKSEVTVVSFAKAIVRVLKKYIPDEEATGETCNECKQPTIIYEEGCKKCTNCGSSKC